MNPIQSFDPTVVTSGTIDTHGINANEQIILFNSSLCCLQLTFADKTNDVLPPSWVRTWKKSSAMSKISYSTLFTVPLLGQPVSIIYGTLYEPGEYTADINAPLQYVYAIGNPGGVSVSGNTLINTGNPPLTQVIQVQPNDVGSGYTVLADNSGNFTVKGDNAGVLTTLLQLIAGVSPEVILAATGVLTSILGSLSADNGNITTDGSGNITKVGKINGVIIGGTDVGMLGVTAAGDVLDQTSSNLILKGKTGGLQFQNAGGTQWSRTAEHFFNGTGSGSFSTGFGSSTPTLIVPDPATASGSSQTIGLTLAPTSVVTTGAGLAWKAMAFTV